MLRGKSLWTLAVLALVLVVGGAAQAADHFTPYRAVCEIHTSGGQGTGTLIGETGDKYALVMSCRHVCNAVGGDVVLNWRWAGGQLTAGKVIHVTKGPMGDFESDVALIMTDLPYGIEPVTVARFKKSEGPWVMAGYRDDSLRITYAGHSLIDRHGRTYIMTPVMRGMSGGPVFNKYGQLVGTVIASDFANHAIICSGDELHDAIAKFRRPSPTEIIIK